MMQQTTSFSSGFFSYMCFTRVHRLRRRILQLAVMLALFGSTLAPAPVLAAGASPQATISVTTQADEAGFAGSGCSLREAITAANTNAVFGGCPAGSSGADTISLPAGTYTLSLANASEINEDNNATGDLDINQSLTLLGAGPASTIIQAGTTNANGIDKVIAANPFCAVGVNVTIAGVTVRNGFNTQPFGAADFSYTGAGIDWCAGGSGETFTLSDALIADNTNLHGYGGGLNIDSLSGSTTVVIGNVTFQNNIIANDATSSQGTGAGINIFTDHSTIAITDSLFSGNQALRTNAGGGAIAYRPTSDSSLQVSASTFSDNSAQGSGGAFFVDAHSAGTTLSIQNSQFTNNIASASFGGGLYLASIPANTNAYQLTHLTITGNHAGSAGGGVYVGPANVTMSNSRIVANSAPAGSGLYKNVDPATAAAANNWWGCSTGPAAAPCDQAASAGGTLGFTPWFRDQLTSASPALVTNQSTDLTASFLTNSAGGAVPLADLAQMIGQPLTWAASLGALGGADAAVQADGTAKATFTASGVGSAVISAKVDNDLTQGPSSNILNLTVAKANTTAVIGAHTPDPSLLGQPVTVSVAVTGEAGNAPTPPAGTITVASGADTCTITLPATSCDLSFATFGPKTISATYHGDANFNASPVSAPAAHTVNTLILLPIISR